MRLSVRTDVTNPATEIASTDLLENKAVTATNPAAPWGTGSTATMTLQQAVFAGIVDPGNIAIVREVLYAGGRSQPDCGAAAPVNCDTAVFSGPRANYTITNVAAADGNLAFARVTDNAGTDGIDIVRNVERLQVHRHNGELRPPGRTDDRPSNRRQRTSNRELHGADEPDDPADQRVQG